MAGVAVWDAINPWRRDLRGYFTGLCQNRSPEEATNGEEDSVYARVGRADHPCRRRAGREERRRGRLEGDGRRSGEDDSAFRFRHGVRVRAGVQPELAVARMEDEERNAHH